MEGSAAHTLRFTATMEAFETALGDMAKLMDATGLSREARYNVELVFEEVVTNVVRHGTRGTETTIEFRIDRRDDEVLLTFTDDGVPFDPSGRAEPAPFESLETATLGGLGISVVRNASTGMRYERTPDGLNRLTVAIAAA